MTNHQLIINPLFVIINLTGFAFLSLELFFETLLSIWPTAESSTNRQLIPLNRQLGGRIYRQSIVKTQEFIEGEVFHAPHNQTILSLHAWNFRSRFCPSLSESTDNQPAFCRIRPIIIRQVVKIIR